MSAGWASPPRFLRMVIQENGATAEEGGMVNFSVPLAGMQAAESQFDQAVQRLASLPSRSVEGAGVDQVDLSTEMVALLESRNQFETSVKTTHVADDMLKSTLDLLA